MILSEQTIPIPKKIYGLWESNKRHKVAEGGRGSAKSYSIHGLFAALSMQRKARILVTRETQNSLTDSSLAVLKRVITDWGWSGLFDDTKHGLKCVNGSEFIFRGLQKPDRIKSLDDVQYCIVEEAHAITQRAIDFLIPTIRNDGSEMWWLYNRDLESDPVQTTLIDSGRPDVEHVHLTYKDNPFFPEVLRSEMEWDKANDYEKYEWVWLGEPREVTDAQVFKGKFRVATFETPNDVDRFYFGADWGFSQDPSTLVRAFIRNQILWIDHEAYGVGVDNEDLPELFDVVPRVREWPIVGDSQRPDIMSGLRKHGFVIQGAKKGAGSVEAGVAFLRSFRGVMIHDRCRHTAEEFKLYSYKTDKLTGEVLPVLEDKHNHIIDALRYALERTMRAAGSVGSAAAAEAGL